MSKPYLERRHVELEEEVEYDYDMSVTSRLWWARAYGPLIPTKETIDISRSSKSAGEALLLLKEAIEKQGWELHD